LEFINAGKIKMNCDISLTSLPIAIGTPLQMERRGQTVYFFSAFALTTSTFNKNAQQYLFLMWKK